LFQFNTIEKNNNNPSVDFEVFYPHVPFQWHRKRSIYPRIHTAVLSKVNSSRCDAGCTTTRMRSTLSPINSLCRQSRDGLSKHQEVLNLLISIHKQQASRLGPRRRY